MVFYVSLLSVIAIRRDFWMSEINNFEVGTYLYIFNFISVKVLSILYTFLTCIKY